MAMRKGDLLYMKNVEEIVEQTLLYDFYSELLTASQRKIYEEVFFDDLSLSEVAKEENITRQGVYDMIKRTQKALINYEKKLGLVDRYKKQKDIVSEIERSVKKIKDSDAKKTLTELLKELKSI